MVQPRTVVGPGPQEINCSNALNFMTSTDAIAAKNAFVLITNLFVIKTNAFFAAIASVLVMKFKALEQLISRKKIYPGLKAYCYMITILLE